MTGARLTAAATLGSLLGAEAGDAAAIVADDLVLDSRDARPGSVFVALQGARAHGLEFAVEAVRLGAVAVLYQAAPGVVLPKGLSVPSVAVSGLKQRLGELAGRLYGPAIRDMQLAGITGTNGKTTVAYLVAQAARPDSIACGYLGTLGCGVPPTLTPHALTTPDCFTLHRELAALDTERVAMEVSSHALAQDRIAGLIIGVAAFTNLSHDHLDAHGDFERYARAKSRLFTRQGVRRAVLNMSDPFAARLLPQLSSEVQAIRVRVGARQGSEATVDLEAEVDERGLDGLVLSITGRYGVAAFASPLVGAFNAENLIVALGVLLAWDMPMADACAALAQAVAPPGRLEVVGGGGAQPTVIVDFAHSPDGLERVLDALRPLASGELWCIFGCGGERDHGKRPLMGAAAASGATCVVLTDDNPRGENPAEIIEGIRSGINHDANANIRVEHDRQRAIKGTIAAAASGDVVLIAGKGHETHQWVEGQARPFSDREVATAALRELSS